MSSVDASDGSTGYPSDSDAAEQVRDLARGGKLAATAAAAGGPERARLYRGAYEIAWPVVFDGLTRQVEHDRGHGRCAVSVRHLEPDCLDRFEDDVEAMVDHLLRYANVEIRRLEGWIRSRLSKAAADGHRRRRGERGAQQRPQRDRLARWLAVQLGDDPWLTELAVHILTWVGVPATAGTGLWPYGAWADLRAATTGDPRSTERDVAQDIETVLAAMRTDPVFYERSVERPLGLKQAPVLPAAGATTADATWEPQPLALAQPHEADDARLRDLATVAVDAIAARHARGEDLGQVVVDVVGMVFGSGTGADQMDRPPGTDSGVDDRVGALLDDPQRAERVMRQIREILDLPDT